MMQKRFFKILSAIALCGAVLAQDGGRGGEKNASAQDIADTFYKLNYNPQTPHMKINHTKGFCAAGSFKPSENFTQEYTLPLLEKGELKALVRYSLGGVMQDDRSKIRGMALRLQGRDGSTWTMVMTNTGINFARTPEEFEKFLKIRIPVNGKVDLEKIQQVTQDTPSFRNFEEYLKDIRISKSVANTAYYSVHTFWFDTKEGKKIAARWKFVPLDGVKYFSDTELKRQDADFLRRDFLHRVAKAPIVHRMYLVLANRGDATDDTTAAWRGKHKEVYVGELSVSRDEGQSCDREVFFPNDLPQGVGAPKDPLFNIRNEVYGITFSHRQ